MSCETMKEDTPRFKLCRATGRKCSNAALVTRHAYGIATDVTLCDMEKANDHVLVTVSHSESNGR